MVNTNEKYAEIKDFCLKNSDPEVVKKYSHYFKEGFDGYGIQQKIFEKQRDAWIDDWKDDMSLDDYLILGDMLMRNGKYEEKSFAIAFISAERGNYTPETFDRIANWFNLGISNWATVDVLCMLVLSSFLKDGIVSIDKLKEWTSSDSEWQRRAVPVTLVELLKHGLQPEEALPVIEPLMLDRSEYVQKGIGTLLRGLWKQHPTEVENFLMARKDQCGRLIVQYATEKMDKEDRKRFRKTKKSASPEAR